MAADVMTLGETNAPPKKLYDFFVPKSGPYLVIPDAYWELADRDPDFMAALTGTLRVLWQFARTSMREYTPGSGKPVRTYPSAGFIAKRLGISERSVKRQMQTLVQYGLIVRQQRRNTSANTWVYPVDAALAFIQSGRANSVPSGRAKFGPEVKREKSSKDSLYETAPTSPYTQVEVEAAYDFSIYDLKDQLNKDAAEQAELTGAKRVAKALKRRQKAPVQKAKAPSVQVTELMIDRLRTPFGVKADFAVSNPIQKRHANRLIDQRTLPVALAMVEWVTVPEHWELIKAALGLERRPSLSAMAQAWVGDAVLDGMAGRPIRMQGTAAAGETTEQRNQPLDLDEWKI